MKEPSIYQVKVPKKVVNNFINIKFDSDGMVTIWWLDPDDSSCSETTKEAEG